MQRNVLKIGKIILSLMFIASIIYSTITIRTIYRRTSYMLSMLDLISTDQVIKHTFVEEKIVQDLYQIVKDTTEIFDKHNIKYVISSGTLLGAVRHEGLIPWDDDIDLNVFAEQMDDILNLKDEFIKHGYDIKMSGDINVPVYKIYKTDANKDITSNVFIDLFTVHTNKQGNIEYQDETVRKKFNREWFKPEELYPFKKYKFGPLELYGPNQPEPHLKRAYSNNVLEEVVIFKKHNNPEHSRSIKRELTGSFAKPALPKKALLDRI